jgi:hypothetical protein
MKNERILRLHFCDISVPDNNPYLVNPRKD